MQHVWVWRGMRIKCEDGRGSSKQSRTYMCHVGMCWMYVAACCYQAHRTPVVSAQDGTRMYASNSWQALDVNSCTFSDGSIKLDRMMGVLRFRVSRHSCLTTASSAFSLPSMESLSVTRRLLFPSPRPPHYDHDRYVHMYIRAHCQQTAPHVWWCHIDCPCAHVHLFALVA